MKKHTITALAAALCLLCTGMPVIGIPQTAELTVSAAAAALTSGDFTYTIENDEVTITKWAGEGTSVKLPAEIDGMPVVAIGPTVFFKKALTSVTIPEGIRTIGSGAFWHCTALETVSLPSTLTAIEGMAFNDCPALEKLEIPKSVTSIGKEAFTGTAWFAAQMEASPFVVVNGILIDASAAAKAGLDKNQAARQAAEDERQAQLDWRKAGKRNQIITNQVGYFKTLSKQATLVTDAKDAVKFELLDADGKSVFSGKSTPFGKDATSGDNVHILDFTEFQKEGVFTLKAETGETSRAFTIGINKEYSGLLYDALNYFYQNRSGIAIESQYITSGDTEALSRSAAHQPDIAEIQHVWGYEGSSGTQDVTGGWYDAGDHGKYVVNGGIALWMMQNQYERALKEGSADAYADGTMKLPENGNQYPDLLDEARYEMEWMLTMLVQDGDYKDMAYHKIHDDKWTAIGLDPAKDVQERYLLPPSTAATLNLAACAAQSYRLWKELDPDFADKCLTAAKKSYAAAKLHPDVYAPNKEYGGGGAYSDDNVTDEFYWAACELYLSTGEEDYYTDLNASDYTYTIPTTDKDFEGAFDWGHTAALGTLSLWVNQDKLTEKETDKLRAGLMEAGDYFLHVEKESGYNIPYSGYTNAGYQSFVWGSNSFVADNGIVLAYAYDASRDEKYLNGAVGAMDYILGRNALDFSYVTGYGEHSAQYPHHRFWAVMSKDTAPKAPCGVMVGGANASLEDPIMEDSGLVKGETPTQLCYSDHNESYSTNECAINWNAPLAWLTGFLCEQGGGIIAGQESCGTQIPELPKPDPEVIDPLAVKLPDEPVITTIGEHVFGSYAEYVTEVTMPDTVTSVSKEAFSGCTNLTALGIPETIENVGDNAFAGTPWLQEKLKDSPLLVLNGILIDGTTAEGDVEIPEGVHRILGSAFNMNTEITSVTMPDSVTQIGNSAFYGCEKLERVKLPQSLKTIGESAFANTPIQELTIPASVTKVGAEAFINCKSLPEVTVLGKKTFIDREAFGCTSTFTANGQYSYIFIHDILKDFVVKCYDGSTAAAYAKAMGLQTELLELQDETLGDVNADGDVNILDCIAVNKFVIAVSTLTDAQQKAADVNRDGTVDATDSLLILKYALDVIPDFS